MTKPENGPADFFGTRTLLGERDAGVKEKEGEERGESINSGRKNMGGKSGHL